MKIGVISDTHIPVSSTKLPQKVYDYFRDCDLIIHAGDAVDASVIKELEALAETKAVWGNMDSHELRKNLPEKLVLEIEGKTIGVVHGRGPGVRVMQTVSGVFDQKPDIIIFGHSHAPVNREKDGILFFNPGSATDKVFSPYRSFGIIEIEGGNVSARIIKIEDE